MKKASEILTFYFEVIKNSQEVAKKKKKDKEITWTQPPASPSIDTLPNYSALSKPGRLIDTMQLTGP